MAAYQHNPHMVLGTPTLFIDGAVHRRGYDPPHLLAALATSSPGRVGTGHLLTPQNATMVVIDYQPSQFAAVRSMDPACSRTSNRQ